MSKLPPTPPPSWNKFPKSPKGGVWISNGVVQYTHWSNTNAICDVIKQNQSEVGNIDFKIRPNKGEISFVSYCFWHPSTAHIFGTN